MVTEILTSDGSSDVINGTSDWVNEEEFGIRDGFRWSPDSAAIAFWQFDTSRVPVFTLINNTDTLYPVTTSFKHPKPGQPNSAVRVGVVPAAGGPVVWMRTPGDPSNTYIARLEWAGSSREVVLQHLNRLQNSLSVLIGDAATGAVRTIFTDTDETWVEVMDDCRLDGGRAFLAERTRRLAARLRGPPRRGRGQAPDARRLRRHERQRRR
jgi:dipeptidyl-peptidase-4